MAQKDDIIHEADRYSTMHRTDKGHALEMNSSPGQHACTHPEVSTETQEDLKKVAVALSGILDAAYISAQDVGWQCQATVKPGVL